jgi:hypothetical protein
MTITPAGGVVDPVNVYVVDHGIHSSLVFPREDGNLVEFAYSRFDWAALDQDQWYRSLPAIIVPGTGTLGTRDLPGPSTRENVVHQFEITNNHPTMQGLFVVPVSAVCCREVLAKLDQRWAAGKESEVFNQKRGMKFVKDPAQYSIMHNCNTEVSEWLRELGCRVDGPAVIAEIRVRAVPASNGTTERRAASQ